MGKGFHEDMLYNSLYGGHQTDFLVVYYATVQILENLVNILIWTNRDDFPYLLKSFLGQLFGGVRPEDIYTNAC